MILSRKRPENQPERLTIRFWRSTAASWARDRCGWLFLTSTPETRTRLVPLTSLWLDMLVLRLMNRGQPGHRPVWFVLEARQFSGHQIVQNEQRMAASGAVALR